MSVDDLRREISFLRDEMQDLKKCQVQYFTLSVTGTAALLGLTRPFEAAHDPSAGIVFLLPLTILLPCWWIFFDKATTITRIVGYLRVLHSMIDSPGGTHYHSPGFENALSVFRRKEQEHERLGSRRSRLRDTPWRKVPRTLFVGTRHRYWMVNWYTFAGLSVLCWLLSLLLPGAPLCERAAWLGLSGLLVLVSGAYTLYMVVHLTHGRYTYDQNTKTWEDLLSAPVANGASVAAVGAEGGATPAVEGLPKP